ncbi:MAG TPA: hypothetical protein VMJ10_27595 [Kofleriaceae bacterium]|nr:hypothetical protein [Kofleriaceae bacterium]
MCGTAALAHADKPKPIDAKAVVDKLEVFRDELGNLYVLPRPDAFSFEDAQQWVFYGDSKALYQQRIIGASGEQGKQYEFDLWAPRAKGMNVARIEYADNKYQLRCRHTKEGVRVLTALNADEARTALAHATFWPPLWQRQAHLLARDDEGVYYYVDQLRDEIGGNGFRVFVGVKGAMKELAMTNVVSDSGGEIFATRTGQLKIVHGEDGKGYWIKSGKKTELTVLEAVDNRYLIYRDLGIYGPLGAVCDDL